jgi:RHS repeat-associated protein
MIPRVGRTPRMASLETRHYILQNWRADVVALIDPSGDPFEYIRYSPYGVPFVYGAGDVDRNGQVDAFDPQTLSDFNSYGTGGLVVDHDINRDGVVDSADDTLVNDQSNWAIWSQGRGSLDRLGLRKGYAGYEWDPSTSLNHVRHRAYHAEMGRWTQRDPAGYVDGGDLYEYVGGRAVTSNDASGLMRLPCSGSGCTASQPVPAPDPQPRDCVNETSFNNCIACCFARNGGSACIGICLSKINPGDASYPTPVEGPPDSRAEVCAKACAALDSPSGSVACFGGKAIACVCATRSPTGPNAPSGTAQCIATHELINAEMYDCSSGEPLMRKGVGPIQLVCNEAMAYEAAVACLSGKQCEGTPRQRCMCEASKTALTSEWGCRAAFLRGKCTGSKIPTPGEQDDAYGACAASAISIRMGAEAACPK